MLGSCTPTGAIALFFIIFFFFFLTVLGLLCGMRAFSSCGLPAYLLCGTRDLSSPTTAQTCIP